MISTFIIFVCFISLYMTDIVVCEHGFYKWNRYGYLYQKSLELQSGFSDEFNANKIKRHATNSQKQKKTRECVSAYDTFEFLDYF